MLLGAGRARVDSAIDPAVGVLLHKKVGDPVAAGEPLCHGPGQRRGAGVPSGRGADRRGLHDRRGTRRRAGPDRGAALNEEGFTQRCKGMKRGTENKTLPTMRSSSGLCVKPGGSLRTSRRWSLPQWILRISTPGPSRPPSPSGRPWARCRASPSCWAPASGRSPMASASRRPCPTAASPTSRRPTVAGHSGRLVVGTLGAGRVAVLQGRFHSYEGYRPGGGHVPDPRAASPGRPDADPHGGRRRGATSTGIRDTWSASPIT